MSNIIDYMKWRGDLTFAQDSFNEIDNLILSQLVYVELNNIVPGDEEPTISLLDAAKPVSYTHLTLPTTSRV